MRKYIAFAFFAFALCVSSGAVAVPTTLTLCKLAANLNKYANKVVRVKAIYYTDMLEHSGLLDTSCRSIKFNLYDGPKGPYQDTIDKLNNAEGKRYFAGKPVVLNLTFSAILRLAPEPGELPFAKGELGRLHLTRVWKYMWLSQFPSKH
jgi:hypothetical protein